MAIWLKQSVAVDVMLGPFLDSTDGNTVEGALTITQPDIRLSKNGGAFAQKSAAQTLTHGENGWYPANLSTTDTNTLGTLIVAVHESGALPVWREFMVVSAQVWDSFFSTDMLQVDLTQWLGSTPSALLASRVQSFVGAMDNDVVSTTSLAANTGLAPIRSATCTGGAADSITLDAGASSVTDFYKGTRIYLTAGTGIGQSRLCTAYNGTTKVATIAPNWITNPSGGATNFVIRTDSYTPGIGTGGIASTSFAAGAIDAAAIAADAVTAAKVADGTIDAATFAAGAINAAAFASGAIDDDAVAADMDAYSAKVWVVKESTTADHYAVVFFKNGQPVTTGITSPTIQVIKASDGTDLIASGALTEVGALGIYRKDESTNKLVGGAIYFAKVAATIDGSTRSWLQQVGRDSA